MSGIFINYRTGDGKETAHRIYEEFSERYGEKSVFFAKHSIELGDDFPHALMSAVRDSDVVLAVIGKQWVEAEHPDSPGRPALGREGDWVRRELEEAFETGVPVVPVFVGRSTEQLDGADLPPSIAQLAKCQCARVYSSTSARHDIQELGDRLSRQFPALAETDRTAPVADAADGGLEAGPTGSVHNEGQSGGIGHAGGNVTYFHGSTGPVHTGSGTQVNGDQVNGDQVNGTQVNGDHFGGAQVNGDGTNMIAGGGNHVAQNFGPARRRRSGDR